MKKALIFLLSLAVVGAVFAQTPPSITFSGSLQTGLVYQMGDNKVDPVLWNHPNDADKDNIRLRFGAEAKSGANGAKFRLSSVAEDKVGVDYAFTYINLMDSMVLIQAGYKIDDNAWRTTGKGEFDYDPSGIKVQIKPIEGLNLGFAIGAPVKETGAVAAAAPAPAYDAIDVANATYIAGFAYSMAPFGIQAGLKMDMGEMQGVYGGFDYLELIPGLTLTAEAKMEVIADYADGPDAGTDADKTYAAGLSDYSDWGRTTIVETVEYKADALEAGVYGKQFMYGSSDVDMGLWVSPYVKYTVGINQLVLEVTWTNDEYEIDKGASLKKPDYSTLAIAPKVVTKFTDKSKLETGFTYVAQTDMVADNTQKLFLNFIVEW